MKIIVSNFYQYGTTDINRARRVFLLFSFSQFHICGHHLALRLLWTNDEYEKKFLENTKKTEAEMIKNIGELENR